MRNINSKQMSLFNEDKCFYDCDLCYKYYADNGECNENFLLANIEQIKSEISALKTTLDVCPIDVKRHIQRKVLKLEEHLDKRAIKEE